MTLEERALPIPEDIPSADGEVTELARIWWNNGQPAMTIRPAMHEPKIMGAIFAELSWHFSKAYAERYDMDQAMALQAIRDGWVEASAQGDAAEGTTAR